MPRPALAALPILTVALAIGLQAAPPAAPTPGPPETTRTTLNGHTFTLPAGFEIELVAGPPLVNRPIMADFDDEGRLYVADSSGSNAPLAEQLKTKPHRIVRLEAGEDGRFTRSTVFAGQMMFPEGVLWHEGSLYVSAVPTIWKLTDRDGDGVADERVAWVDPKTMTGCGNDLHGPYEGPDGWIYWCKGAFARQTYERPGGPPLVTRAAHIFRGRPDGTGIEPVMTGGMDNPVEVAFTPGGERVFTTTFLQHPGGGRRDGIIHAVYGGVYGKDHDVIDGHPRTSRALMPVMTHLGPAAPSGLLRYQSAAFGPGYADNLFATLFNLQKVTRHVVTPDGATFAARDVDFLTSDNRDFHPTDVLEDADGSLLVIDTGGWYKLCCPTSQLHKPDILGGIYRVRRTGVARAHDPRGLSLAWKSLTPDDLAGLLDDPRPVVRRRAVRELGRRGPAAIESLAAVLKDGRTPEARRNAVWASARLIARSDRPDARALAGAALGDPDETVRHVAIHVISLWRDRNSVAKLIPLLSAEAAHNRRAAAEALGRIGDVTAVPALLAAAGTTDDHILTHSYTFALIEIADRDSTAAGLTSRNDRTKRAALVALDQMPGGTLDARRVAEEFTAADPDTRQTAFWIAGRHPEWGTALAGFFARQIARTEHTDREREDLVEHLTAFALNHDVQTLLARAVSDPAMSRDSRRIALTVMGRSGVKQTPAEWVRVLAGAVADEDASVRREAVGAARALPLDRTPGAERLGAALLTVGMNPAEADSVRLAALAAAPAGPGEMTPRAFEFLRTQLDPDKPVSQRALAAEQFGRSRLSSPQLLALADAVKTAGPLEIEKLTEPFARSRDDAVGLRLVAALASSPVKSGLRVESLRQRLAGFGPTVQARAAELYGSISQTSADQRATLDRLAASLLAGDVRRGQAVFNSQKAACSACHAVGYLGGTVGPDLTRIGQIRTDRDLLEAIVYPSASFVRGYEPVAVTTKAGKLFNGVVRKDAADEVVLATGPNQEVRLPRGDIEEVTASTVSVMPAGLDRVLTKQELADLIAFLKACR